jgi:hypothetical protein
MFAVMARVNGYGPRYLTPYAAALDVIAGWMISGALMQLRVFARYALLLVLVCGLAASAVRALARVRPGDDRPFRDAIASLHVTGLDRASLLVPQLDLPAFHYYLPGAQVHGYLDPPTREMVTRAHAAAIILEKRHAFEIQPVPSSGP